MTCLYNDPLARSQFHAQAIATMGIDPAWDQAVTNYIVWDIRGKADEAYGPNELASQDREREAINLAKRLGPKWREHPEGAPISEAMTAACRRAEDDRTANFYMPMWASHRQLVDVPAPSLAAVAFKAAIIELHEVWMDGALESDCIAIIDADLVRLNGEGAAEHADPSRETWDVLSARHREATRAADTATSENDTGANRAEYKAWREVMKSEAPDLAAVLWKLDELFGKAGRERIEGSMVDNWLFQFTDVILADVERLKGDEA